MDEQLKALIVERLFLEIKPADIATETPLAEYGVDSFLLQELIVGIEEQFGVRFLPEDITADNLKSVASLRDLIQKKLAESK